MKSSSRWAALIGTTLVVLAACTDVPDVAVTSTSASLPSTTMPASTTTTTPTVAAPPTNTTTTTTATTLPLPNDQWTAVVASLPLDEYDETSARAFLTDLGKGFELLRSDDFGSLRAGYWVVFRGRFASNWEAIAECDKVRGVAPDCYARYVGPDPTNPIGHDMGTFVGLNDDGQLVVVSLESGNVLRTIGESGDGSLGKPHLSADGRSFYASMFHEDSWYSCESSAGSFVRVDTVTGRVDGVGTGYAPVLSTDGTMLLYLEASQCLPDPQEPGSWVITPADMIVVRDLETGAESRRKMTFSGGGASYETEFASAAWDGADAGAFVLDRTGRIRHVGLTGDRTDEVVAQITWNETDWWSLVGVNRESGEIIAVRQWWQDDSLSTEVHAIGADGAPRVIHTAAGAASVALDRTGRHLLIINGKAALVDGTELDLAVPIRNVAW